MKSSEALAPAPERFGAKIRLELRGDNTANQLTGRSLHSGSGRMRDEDIAYA